jgi:IS30 family transposase
MAEGHEHKAKAFKFHDSMRKVAVQTLQDYKQSLVLISVRDKVLDRCPISQECLYQWIWACKHDNKRANQTFKRLCQDLRHANRRRKKVFKRNSRSVITGQVSIENNPADVQSRKRIGDIEVDLMKGNKHQEVLIVMTGRATFHTNLN